MARNKVQFQKGMSLNTFLQYYGTEDQCFEALYKWCWQKGFRCPNCEHDRSCQLTNRKLQQCNRCHHQTSITAGTILESTKLPLTTWFQAIYLISQGKKCISVMQLHRQLGISYNAAWGLKHKLMQVMMERDQEYKLSGLIEIDDAYLGGERTGCKPGRGAADKSPFVAAVEKTEEGHPLRIKLSVVKGFRKTEIAAWSKQHLTSGSIVVSDGLSCFTALAEEGYQHDRIICGGGRASVEEPKFYWVNTILGNLKSTFRGIYHAVRPKHMQRYLAEFQYRFNRRFDLSNLIPRLAYVALRTPPMPERLLKSSLA
jgi:hypothetical protein